MSRKPLTFVMSAFLAVGALALVTIPAEGRPRGGGGHGGGGGRGFGGGRGGFGGGRGGFGGGRGYGGYGGFGLGYGLGGYGGYGVGYSGYGNYGGGYGGYNSYYSAPSYAYSNYAPYYSVDSSAYYPPTTTIPPGDGTAAVPAASQGTTADNKAHMLVVVPENSEVWFQGQKMTASGTQREFVSPPLTQGDKYDYQIRVRYTKEDGQVVDETRTVHVKTNDQWSIDFTKPEPKK
jgi:uncharacterized protein (TIGR03000 family)